MVAARISRQSGEVAAGAGAPASVTRVDVEVAAEAQTANAVDPARVSRQSVEVFAKRSATASLTRVDVEVAGEAQGANAVDPMRISRQSAEVFISISPRLALTRVDVEVAGEAQTANAVDPARISRQTAEAFARRGSAGPIVPLALNADAEVFMHDWADECVLRSSYLTDVVIAATGAESRLGLRIKPARAMDVVWRQSADEFDAADVSRLDRLYVFARRLTGSRFAVPLYPDQRDLGAAYISTDTELLFDTTQGRWFVGGRVAVVQRDWLGGYASHSFHTISEVFSDRIVLDAQLGVAVPADSVVVPMIDCETSLEAELFHETGCLAEVSVTVHEVAGANQLPASRSDTPAGTPTHDGVPILDVDPDWSDGVRRRRSRQGAEFTSGRARGVAPLAARAREVHELSFLCQRGCGDDARQDGWRLVEFFDTRLGRLRSFWHVDQERIWAVQALSANFVEITPFGAFDDFSEELQGGQIGLVMSSGDFYVRDAVTVQDLGASWRITVDPVLPALSVASVDRVARARRVRFDSDEMEERWLNAGLVETSLTVIEVLEEKDVTL